MFLYIREGARSKRGTLYVLCSPSGHVIPWYPNNTAAMLPKEQAEKLLSVYNRRLLGLPPLHRAMVGASWEFALREIYGIDEDGNSCVVGVHNERTVPARKVKKTCKNGRNAKKAAREAMQFRRHFAGSGKIVISGMNVEIVA